MGEIFIRGELVMKMIIRPGAIRIARDCWCKNQRHSGQIDRIN